METKVYVDVLLVLNYIINMLLIMCTAKLTGRRPKRRRIVAAALFGSASSLTIFLPFFGFWSSIFSKIIISAVLVLVAFSYRDGKSFVKQWFAFFAVNFFFAGVMLAVWMAFSPSGMIYYNGIVYFDISSFTLIVTTIAAYAVLTLAHKLTRGGRVATAVYRTDILYGGRTVSVRGLVDTGNSLYEPFSDTPVMVCSLGDIAPLLPDGAAEAILRGEHMTSAFNRFGLRLRLVPYGNVGGAGTVPAFHPELVRLTGEGGEKVVERVYVAMTTDRIGGDDYNALLNPDLIGARPLAGLKRKNVPEAQRRIKNEGN